MIDSQYTTFTNLTFSMLDSCPIEEKYLLRIFGNSEVLDDVIFLSGHLRDVIFLELVLLRLIRLFIRSHVFFHVSNIILKVLMIVSFFTQTSKD